MNKKRIVKTADGVKKTFRDSLFLCFALIFFLQILGIFVLTPLYKWFGECAYGFSVDVEASGGVLEFLCEFVANLLFYITSFLGTAVFFFGAAYTVYFSISKKYAKSASAAIILFLGMSLQTVATFVAYLILKSSEAADEYVFVENYEAILLDAGFLLVRVLFVFLVAVFLNKIIKGAATHLYALTISVFMFLCAAGLEFIDTTIPFLMKNTPTTADVITIVLSYVLYILHAALGYFLVRFFIDGKAAFQRTADKK